MVDIRRKKNLPIDSSGIFSYKAGYKMNNKLKINEKEFNEL